MTELRKLEAQWGVQDSLNIQNGPDTSIEFRKQNLDLPRKK